MLSFDEFRAIQNRRRVNVGSDDKNNVPQKKSKSGNNSKSGSTKKVGYNDFDDAPIKVLSENWLKEGMYDMF